MFTAPSLFTWIGPMQSCVLRRVSHTVGVWRWHWRANFSFFRRAKQPLQLFLFFFFAHGRSLSLLLAMTLLFLLFAALALAQDSDPSCPPNFPIQNGGDGTTLKYNVQNFKVDDTDMDKFIQGKEYDDNNKASAWTAYVSSIPFPPRLLVCRRAESATNVPEDSTSGWGCPCVPLCVGRSS